MSNLTTPIDPTLRASLAELFAGGGLYFVDLDGEQWYETAYTGTPLATGLPVRECWALGHGDAKRMFVTAEGGYYMD